MNKAESKYFNTALLMNQALLYLLEKQEIDEITIKSICLKAGVNRSTFYLHYDTSPSHNVIIPLDITKND